MKARREGLVMVSGVATFVAVCVFFMVMRNNDASNGIPFVRNIFPFNDNSSNFSLEDQLVAFEDLEKVYLDRYQGESSRYLKDIREGELRERFALVAGFDLPESAVVAFANFNDRALETCFRIEFNIPVNEVDMFMGNMETHRGFRRDQFKRISSPILGRKVGLDFTMNTMWGFGRLGGRALLSVDPSSGNVSFCWNAIPDDE